MPLNPCCKPSRRESASALTLWLRVLLACALSGCATPPPAPPAPARQDSRLPRFDDPRFQKPTEMDLGPEAPTLGPRRHFDLMKLKLPLDATLEPAWANVLALPNDATVWTQVGLRGGVLRGPAVEQFIKHLPPRRQVMNSRINTADDFMVLTTVPALPGQRWLEIPLPDQTAPLSVREGRLQWLLNLAAGPTEGLQVQCVPQVYLAQRTLLPRTPAEKSRDGRLLTELAQTFDLLPGDVLVLAVAELPAVPKPTPEPEAESDPQANATQNTADSQALTAAPAPEAAPPAATTDKDAPAPPATAAEAPTRWPREIPNHVGAHLMLSDDPAGPVQWLILLRWVQ